MGAVGGAERDAEIGVSIVEFIVLRPEEMSRVYKYIECQERTRGKVIMSQRRAKLKA
jgi:hypothetical protein